MAEGWRLLCRPHTLSHLPRRPAVFCNNSVNFSQTTGWTGCGWGFVGQQAGPKTNTFWSGGTIFLARLLANLCEMIWLRSRQIIREICAEAGQLFKWTWPGQTLKFLSVSISPFALIVFFSPIWAARCVCIVFHILLVSWFLLNKRERWR